MMWRAFSRDLSMSNERAASTSVDTFPGTIFRISVPNSTSSLSRVASICSSIDPPYLNIVSQTLVGERVAIPVFTFFLPYSTATSINLAYSGFLEAARMSDGLVVAS
jgi:hypothetical protein